MWFLKIVMCIFSLTKAHFVPTVDHLKGSWIQIYSNYYVQTTSEIDWKCVTINLTPINESLVKINKTASLHGISSNIISKETKYSVTLNANDTVLTSGKQVLSIRKWGSRDDNKTLDYLILTHSNNISLFVWTQNFQLCLNKYNDDIVNTLTEWKFTGSYKKPLLSYNTKCLL
jgi:hypothetical protein